MGVALTRERDRFPKTWMAALVAPNQPQVIAAGAIALSSLSVVGNSLRLTRMRSLAQGGPDVRAAHVLR
jgi:hypothetical protein